MRIPAPRPALFAGLLLLLSACHPPELPEHDSPAALLYAQRCGQCHIAYDPRTLTAAMWNAQMIAMEGKMRDAQVAPLSPEQRQAILDYLERNAGAQ